MSTPFTIDQGSWQEKAEELRLAVSERYFAINNKWLRFEWNGASWEWNTDGDGTIADTLQGLVNLQSSTFWRGIQGYIDSFAQRYIEVDENGDMPDYSGQTWPGIINAEGGYWLNFCRIVGGELYTSDEDYGWPRSNSKDVDGNLIMTRGYHIQGDYIGYWIVDSMVDALSNLVAFWGAYLPSENDQKYGNNYGRIGPLRVDVNDAWNDSWDGLIYDNPAIISIGSDASGYLSSIYVEPPGVEGWYYRAVFDDVDVGGQSINLTKPDDTQMLKYDIYIRAADQNNVIGMLGENCPEIDAGTVYRSESAIEDDAHTSLFYGASSPSGIATPPIPATPPLGSTTLFEYYKLFSLQTTSSFNFTNA